MANDNRDLELKLFQRIALLGFPNHNVYIDTWDKDNYSTIERVRIRYISEKSPGIIIVISPNDKYKPFFVSMTHYGPDDMMYNYNTGDELSLIRNTIYNMGSSREESIEEASKMTDEELLLLIKMV